MNVQPPRPAEHTAASPHTPQLPDRTKGLLMRRAARASVGVSTLLVIVKLGAYALTGSVAILAALADSAVDLVASLGNLFAVGQSLTPADHQHRFGHGKAEPLAGLAQAAFITGSATFLVFESMQHLVEPHPLQNEFAGVAVMLFSIVATFGLVAYQRLVVRRTGSPAISADNMHYAGDLLTNAGIIVAILLSTRLHWYLADPLIGLAVAAVIAWSAWHVFRQSYDQLMDRELPELDRQRIKTIVLAHPCVRGVHDLRTRAAGTLSFIQLHIEMDPAMTLGQAHEASDEVEESLREAFPGAEIIIHQDPHGIEKPPDLALS
jgi:ferrous-iron efflux pump FieF